MAQRKGRQQWTRRVRTRRLGIRKAENDAVRKIGAVCEGREYARYAARKREIYLPLVRFVIDHCLNHFSFQISAVLISTAR